MNSLQEGGSELTKFLEKMQRRMASVPEDQDKSIATTERLNEDLDLLKRACEFEKKVSP
jgi:hypothetical protein